LRSGTWDRGEVEAARGRYRNMSHREWAINKTFSSALGGLAAARCVAVLCGAFRHGKKATVRCGEVQAPGQE
jgi:hypothetical protein